MPLEVLVGKHPLLNLLLQLTLVHAQVLLHLFLCLLIESPDLADLLRVEDVFVSDLLEESRANHHYGDRLT